jgi:hypothetical protein
MPEGRGWYLTILGCNEISFKPLANKRDTWEKEGFSDLKAKFIETKIT